MPRAGNSKSGASKLGGSGPKTALSTPARPVRATAGKRKTDSGFVDSGFIEIDDDDSEELNDLFSEDEQSDDSEASDDSDVAKSARPTKRVRSPTPDFGPLDQVVGNGDEAELPSEPEDTEGKSIVLNIEIPKGYHGTLSLKIDKSMLTTSTPIVLPHPQAESRAVVQSPQSTWGFTILPPEIRNQIYDLLFVADAPIVFAKPKDNFRRSGQFLRTCKIVHAEGSGILYGKNRFMLERERHTQSRYFEERKEIGYGNVRQWLTDIGPTNRAKLRDIHLSLEDAAPSATQYLVNEQRRYVNDMKLMACLHLLRDTKLQTFTLGFHGRRLLLRSDGKFLDFLKSIKADEVVSHELRWSSYNKIHMALFNEIKDAMTRKKKLYVEKPGNVSKS